MIYYQISLLTNKEDDIDNPPYKGTIKVIKWLKYNSETNLPLNHSTIDESLAMKILIQNLQLVESTIIASNDPQITNIGTPTEYVKNEADLVRIIAGQFEKVMILKYESDYVF